MLIRNPYHPPSEPKAGVDAQGAAAEQGEAAEILTPGQEAAIAALIGSPTYAAAAQAAGVGERTLRRWINSDPQFRRRLHQARSAVFDQAVRLLYLASPKAAGVLDGIAQDDAAPKTARVSAARALLHYSCRGRELADVDARLDMLEDRLDAIDSAVNKKVEAAQT